MTSGDQPVLAGSASACWMGGSSGVSSAASAAGRMNGTSSPARRPASAMSGASVLSINRSMTPESRAARAVYSSSVWPASARTFFPGTPFEPPRAGTRPSTVNGFGLKASGSGRASGSRLRLEMRRVLNESNFAQQFVHRRRGRHRIDVRDTRAADVTHVQMIRRIVAPQEVESRAPQIRDHRPLGQVIRMIDLDRVLDGPVAQVRRAEVDDVDEQQSVVGQQLAHARQRAGDIQQMIDRLADDDRVEAASAEVVLLDEPGHRLESEALRLLHFERRRVDERPLEPELLLKMGRDDAGRPTDVEQRLACGARHERTDETGALNRVVALLVLDGAGVDHTAMERADQRAVDAVVEPAVRLRRHARVEEHQAALTAGVRLRRISVAIAVRQDDELGGATQVAGGQRLLW